MNAPFVGFERHSMARLVGFGQIPKWRADRIGIAVPTFETEFRTSLKERSWMGTDDPFLGYELRE